MEIGGTYPMLYAFFDAAGQLRRDAFIRQIEAGMASGAAGIAVLGLGTEVAKLGRAERRQIVEWVIEDVAGRLPVAVTIADGNVPDMIESARFAVAAGASWLILQPPRPPISATDLVSYFGAVAQSVECPVAIQNAPEFLGIGLSPAELLELNAAHPNVAVVKAESTAVAVARVIGAIGNRMKVFNGRAGLELTDNFRAGVDGMIPGIETIDLQIGVERAMRAGDHAKAEAIYARLLPAVSFMMHGPRPLPALRQAGRRVSPGVGAEQQSHPVRHRQPRGAVLGATLRGRSRPASDLTGDQDAAHYRRSHHHL